MYRSALQVLIRKARTIGVPAEESSRQVLCTQQQISLHPNSYIWLVLSGVRLMSRSGLLLKLQLQLEIGKATRGHTSTSRRAITGILQIPVFVQDSDSSRPLRIQLDDSQIKFKSITYTLYYAKHSVELGLGPRYPSQEKNMF